MFEYVKNFGLKPKRPYRARAKTDLIVLHNVGGTMSCADIHKMHMADPEANYSGIAYNIYVDKDGTTIWGRGLEYEGGHVANGESATKGVNARSVGIVANGNFMKEKMSKAQEEALMRVVADVVRYYGFTSISQIVSHREIAGRNHTDCPGTYFPADEIREYIRTYGQAPVPPTEPPAEPPVEETPNFRMTDRAMLTS